MSFLTKFQKKVINFSIFFCNTILSSSVFRHTNPYVCDEENKNKTILKQLDVDIYAKLHSTNKKVKSHF